MYKQFICGSFQETLVGSESGKERKPIQDVVNKPIITIASWNLIWLVTLEDSIPHPLESFQVRHEGPGELTCKLIVHHQERAAGGH